MRFRYNVANFLHYPKLSRKTHHSSPVRARYFLSFADSPSDLYSAPSTALIYAISCYIEPRCNDTQLFITIRLFIDNIFRNTLKQPKIVSRLSKPILQLGKSTVANTTHSEERYKLAVWSLYSPVSIDETFICPPNRSVTTEFYITGSKSQHCASGPGRPLLAVKVGRN